MRTGQSFALRARHGFLRSDISSSLLCHPESFNQSPFIRLAYQLAAHHEVHQRPVRGLPARGDTHQQEEEDPRLQGALLHILHTSHRPLVRASFSSSQQQTDPLLRLPLPPYSAAAAAGDDSDPPGTLTGQSSHKLAPSLALFSGPVTYVRRVSPERRRSVAETQLSRFSEVTRRFVLGYFLTR